MASSPLCETVVIRYRVSKVIVRLEDELPARFLMSLKSKPGSSSNGKLEFLGGRHEAGENALDALIRELSEEDRSGCLAEAVCVARPEACEMLLDDALHFVFQLTIASEMFEKLNHDPSESLGFRLVEEKDLVVGELFTRKTNGILAALELRDG